MVIAVVGAHGKLGSMIVTEIKHANHTPVEIEKDDNIENLDMTNIDVCIDASTPKATASIAKACTKFNVPLLVACTGHTPKQITKIKKLSKNNTAKFCPNLSVGMNLIIDFLTNANLPNDTDACIFEQHHTQKLDSPSGTALWIQQLLSQKLQTPVEITSSRFSDVAGTHKITLRLSDETLEITHIANSRKAFAHGALQKALELRNRKEISNVMPDIIGDNHDQN